MVRAGFGQPLKGTIPVRRPNLRRLIASLATALALSIPAGVLAQDKPVVIYSVEQMVSPTLTPELMEKIKPMHSLKEVEDLLKANSIPFTWRKAELDAGAADPALIAQIEALPPGEVFVIPRANTLIYSVIIGKRPKPVV
jgi:hypothetical protein